MAKKSKKAPKKPASKKPAPKKSSASKKSARKATPRKVVAKARTTRSATKRKAAPATRIKPATPPTGLISAAPGFTVGDIAKSMAWYQDVLGFSVGERWESDGQLRGAEMRRDGVSINLGQDDWKQGRDRLKGQAVRIYISMGSSIEDYANGVVARGGVLSQALNEGWGMKAFGIDDPDGFKLTFFSRLS